MAYQVGQQAFDDVRINSYDFHAVVNTTIACVSELSSRTASLPEKGEAYELIRRV